MDAQDKYREGVASSLGISKFYRENKIILLLEIESYFYYRQSSTEETTSL